MDDEPDRAWIAFALMWAAVLFAASMAAFLMIVGPANAQAQQAPCAPFAQWSAALTKVKQKLIGTGLVGETHAVMFWATEGGTHWTILSVEAATRRACVIAAGADWDQGRIPAIGERGA